MASTININSDVTVTIDFDDSSTKMCNKCKVTKLIEQFMVNGKIRAICNTCRELLNCEHGTNKYYCKICKGSGICSHDIQKSSCKECSPHRFCIHERRKNRCAECAGSSLCEHESQRSICKTCSPIGYLKYLMRIRCSQLFNSSDINLYLGCDIEFLKQHIESLFFPGMSWSNHGEWFIDFKLAFNTKEQITPEERTRRFHWSNIRPIWYSVAIHSIPLLYVLLIV